MLLSTMPKCMVVLKNQTNDCVQMKWSTEFLLNLLFASLSTQSSSRKRVLQRWQFSGGEWNLHHGRNTTFFGCYILIVCRIFLNRSIGCTQWPPRSAQTKNLNQKRYLYCIWNTWTDLESWAPHKDFKYIFYYNIFFLSERI